MQRHEMLNGEEGIRTLARFNTSTPLARAPLQPLEYFSITDTTIPDKIISSKCFCMFGLYSINDCRFQAISYAIDDDTLTSRVTLLE